MSCEYERKRDVAALSESEFAAHAHNCPHCAAVLAQEDQVVRLAAELEAPGTDLWPSIEQKLRREQKNRARWRFGQGHAFWRWAAILVVAVALGSYTAAQFQTKPDGKILDKRALERVKTTEAEYTRAIADLAELAEPHLARMDLDLMLTYRDRLAMIDSQIEVLRDAVAGNPGHAHLRRYMRLALLDKRETLASILDIAPAPQGVQRSH